MLDMAERVQGLFRNSRPGFPEHRVNRATVDAWMAEAHRAGIKTIICLLGSPQFDYYQGLGPEGLLGAYREGGFVVLHRPVEEQQSPPVSAGTLAQVYFDFHTAEKPVLVHGSANAVRTGTVVRHLANVRPAPELLQVEGVARRHRHAHGEKHFRQVARLALQMYDRLAYLHGLDPRYRAVLWAAAMLHDIGVGRMPSFASGTPLHQSHAWHSADLIFQYGIRIASPRADTLEIATVASLHRLETEPPPSEECPIGPIHPEIRAQWIDGEIPQPLLLLAAILRVANGLDHTHDDSVQSVHAQGRTLHVKPAGNPNIPDAVARGRLLKCLLGVQLADASLATRPVLPA